MFSRDASSFQLSCFPAWKLESGGGDGAKNALERIGKTVFFFPAANPTHSGFILFLSWLPLDELISSAPKGSSASVAMLPR